MVPSIQGGNGMDPVLSVYLMISGDIDQYHPPMFNDQIGTLLGHGTVKCWRNMIQTIHPVILREWPW